MFITFEGIEGCGKSTQAALLADFLSRKQIAVCLSREPGGSELGKKLRGILLHLEQGDLSAWAELFLYLADRAEHVQKVIKPALDSGQTVIVDRFTDSTLAYQGHGRGLSLHSLQEMNQLAAGGLEPDLTIVFDLPAEIGLMRARNRNKKSGLEDESRFEAQDIQFHRLVRQGYLELASNQPDRVKLLDASGQEQDIFGQVLKILALDNLC